MHNRCRSEGKITFQNPYSIKIQQKSTMSYLARAKEKLNNYERDTRQLLIRNDYGLECPQHQQNTEIKT